MPSVTPRPTTCHGGGKQIRRDPRRQGGAPVIGASSRPHNLPAKKDDKKKDEAPSRVSVRRQHQPAPRPCLRSQRRARAA